MADWRPESIAARVVAWHNRQPLARRIRLSDVHSIGLVALPFSRPASAGELTRAALTTASTGAASSAEGGADSGGSLRERAMARSRQQQPGAEPAVAARPAPPPDVPAPPRDALRPAFSDPVIEPIPTRKVAAWAQQHGQPDARLPAELPIKRVALDRTLVRPDEMPHMLYVFAAAIDIGGQRIRLLVPPDDGPVLGQHLFSPARLGLAVLTPVLLIAAAIGWSLVRRGAPVDDEREAVAAPAAGGPGSAARASRPAWVAASATAALAPGAAAQETAVNPKPVGETAVPASVAPTVEALRAVEPTEPAAEVRAASPAAEVRAASPAASDPTRRIGNVISEQDKAAARDWRKATRPDAGPPGAGPRAQALAPELALHSPDRATPNASTDRAGTDARPAAAPRAESGRAASAVAAAEAAAPARGLYALSTRPLRTRAESEQVLSAMQALLRHRTPDDFRVEIVPEGDDWRVVGFPFARRTDAQEAGALLASRGMKVQVVNF
jgi:hypothetical protein